MTTTFSNQEQENLSQLIFNSIDEIGKKMEETPDLSLDVLSFIKESKGFSIRHVLHCFNCSIYSLSLRRGVGF